MVKQLKRAIYNTFVAIRKQTFRTPERVLNNGERFDPFLTRFFYQDVSHVPRYTFACKQIKSSDTVLDIACGTGWGTEMLSKHCCNATGVDLSDSALEYARKKRNGYNLNFIRSDFFEFSGAADVVVSFETIEHLKGHNLPEILDKLTSLSNKMIIGSVPYQEQEGANPHHVLFNLSESDFSKLREIGELQFYYQNQAGEIMDSKEQREVQNLLFIFRPFGGN